MARNLAALVACSIAFGAQASGAGAVSEARIQELMASRDRQEVSLQALRARDRDVLVQLADALSRKYGELLKGSEMVFTRLVEDGNILYRMDFVGLRNADHARALCEILELDTCMALSGGGQMRLLRSEGDQTVSAIGAIDEPFAFGGQVEARSFNPEAREIEARVRKMLDPLGIYPLPRPATVGAQEGQVLPVETATAPAIDEASPTEPQSAPVDETVAAPAAGAPDHSLRPVARPLTGDTDVTVIEYFEDEDDAADAPVAEEGVEMLDDDLSPSLEMQDEGPVDTPAVPEAAPDESEQVSIGSPAEAAAEISAEIPAEIPAEASVETPAQSKDMSVPELLNEMGAEPAAPVAAPVSLAEEEAQTPPAAAVAPMEPVMGLSLKDLAMPQEQVEPEVAPQGEEEAQPETETEADVGRGGEADVEETLAPLLLEPSMLVAPDAPLSGLPQQESFPDREAVGVQDEGPAPVETPPLVQPDEGARLDLDKLLRDRDTAFVEVADAAARDMFRTMPGLGNESLGPRAVSEGAAVNIPGIGKVDFARIESPLAGIGRDGRVQLATGVTEGQPSRAAPETAKPVMDPVLVATPAMAAKALAAPVIAAKSAPLVAANPIEEQGEKPAVASQVVAPPAILPPVARSVALASLPAEETVADAAPEVAKEPAVTRVAVAPRSRASVFAGLAARQDVIRAAASVQLAQAERAPTAVPSVLPKPRPDLGVGAAESAPQIAAAPEAPVRTAFDVALARPATAILGAPSAPAGYTVSLAPAAMEDLTPQITDGGIRIRQEGVKIALLGKVSFDDQFAVPASMDFGGGRDAGRLQKLPDARPDLNVLIASRDDRRAEMAVSRARLLAQDGGIGPIDVAQVPGMSGSGMAPAADDFFGDAAPTPTPAPVERSGSLDTRDRLLAAPEVSPDETSDAEADFALPRSAPVVQEAPKTGVEAVFGATPPSASAAPAVRPGLPVPDASPDRAPQAAPPAPASVVDIQAETALEALPEPVRETEVSDERQRQIQALAVINEIMRAGGQEVSPVDQPQTATLPPVRSMPTATPAPMPQSAPVVGVAPVAPQAPVATQAPVRQAEIPTAQPLVERQRVSEASGIVSRAAPADRPAQDFDIAELRLELSYVGDRDAVMQRVGELKKFFPPVMLEKGRFFGASVPHTPGRYVVGIEARDLKSRDDLIWYMDQMGMPWAMRE